MGLLAACGPGQVTSGNDGGGEAPPTTCLDVVACLDGDGCCPSGCNALTDGDCAPLCGNGVVEPGEDCDGDCPASCNDQDACTLDRGTVSAETCTIQCEHVAVSACAAGDGCCPRGCDRTTDSDCPFYVDATLGRDENDGLTPETAWRTAARASAEPLGPGDRVAFKRGEVWRETFDITWSGSADAPIVVSHYGDSTEPPVFAPTREVDGWTPEANQVFSTPLDVEPVQVVVDGERLMLAHYPDQGYLYVDEDEDPANLSSFVDNDLLTPAADLVGATVLMRANRWDIAVGQVAGFAGQRVTLDAPLTDTSSIRKNVGYVLTNKLWMLDGPGEWFHDAGAGRLYLRVADDSAPAGHRIEVATAVSGIALTGAKHVTLEGLAVRHVGASGIEVNWSEGIRVHGCRVENVGLHGIFVNWPPAGAVVEIEDNTVLGANYTGIMVSADTGVQQQVAVRGNHIEDTAPGFPLVGGASDAAAYSWGFGMGMQLYGNGVQAQGNTVLSSGYSCIALSGANVAVLNNRLERCCLLFDDGGGVYMGGSGHVVRGNTVVDSLGKAEGTPTFFTDQSTAAQGIYADDRSHDIVIESNTVVNADLGLQLHNTYNDQVRDNTFYASRESGIHVSEDTIVNIPGFVHDNLIEGNVVLAPRGAPAVTESYGLGWTVPFASYDHNTYWHQEGRSQLFVRNIYGTTNSYNQYSLDEWRAATGLDSNSSDLSTTYRVVPITGRPTGTTNLMANGTFDTDVAGWSGWPSAVSVAWVGDGGLTGGCLSATAVGAGAGALVTGGSFAIAAGQGYLLRFSLRAATPQSLQAVVRRNGTPWDSLGTSAAVSAGASRTDYALPFVATATATGRFDITSSSDFAFFLDEVDVRQADIFTNDPADDAQILVNPSGVELIVDLGAQTYCDLADQEVTGPVTLPAYTSRILLSCTCNRDGVCNNHETVDSCPSDCP